MIIQSSLFQDNYFSIILSDKPSGCGIENDDRDGYSGMGQVIFLGYNQMIY